MNSRDRCLQSLYHREPDRVPFDLAGSAQTGIHLTAYTNLRRYLGLAETEPTVCNWVGQIAEPDGDLLDRLRVDTRLVPQGSPLTWRTLLQENAPGGLHLRDEGHSWAFTDEWGIGWRMPKEGGFYFDMVRHPLDGENVEERGKNYCWPDPLSPRRFESLPERVRAARGEGKLVVLNGPCAGILEIYSWLRGYLRFYLDLAESPRTAEMFLDKLLEFKSAFWTRVLAEFGHSVDVVNEADDMAGQNGLLLSPDTYRRLIKPRHARLFAAIKKAAPRVKIFFHSCGAIRPLIPDLIEAGVDILNPVQLSAKGMNPFELKRDFGKDLVFWGGGVDTQGIFTSGTPQEIRDHVKRNIEALAPGGGFMFATVHNTQANVPPQNFMAMWETLQEYGIYR
jgi:uroporphyrinogen decarboxylase